MNAMNDLKFVILAILGLAIAWFALGGPARSNLDDPFLGGLRDGESISQGRTYDDRKDIGRELDRVEDDLSDIEEELKKAQSNLEASAYKGDIEIDSYRQAKRDSPNEEYIKLEVSKRAPDKINITGWKLVSPVTGTVLEIKKGSYLPYSAQVNPEENIFINPGQTIYIITGRSPIGVSFKTNKCVGYFEQFQDFEPSLPKQCPEPIEDLYDLVDTRGTSGDLCIDFVEDMKRCEVYLESVPANLNGPCATYITEKVNYNTCVELHKDDKDFRGDEWRIYLGNTREAWKQSREVIKLIDTAGKTVDVVTY